MKSTNIPEVKLGIVPPSAVLFPPFAEQPKAPRRYRGSLPG